MDATVRFYAGTLGMPLVMTLMAGPMRHYFFEIDAETFRKGSGSPGPYPVQLDHISFNVPDERALLLLQDRIRAAGSEVTEVVDHDVLKSVYFTDPNGIALEASYWVVDGTGRPFDPTDEEVFLDPDPVPAVAELAGDGLNSTVKTSLV
jgi:catechol 2,3-dioxygenase-like lactoylglutathione lyase family enzyme